MTSYHGLFSALLILVPVLTFTLLWLVLQGAVIDRIMMDSLPNGVLDGLDSGGVQLVLAEIKSVSRGQVFGTPEDWKIAAAEHFVHLHQQADWWLVAAVSALSLGLLAFARTRVAADFAPGRVLRALSRG